jgi:hypothetical protein
VDLSEKHLNDESFKLATHAFSKVQTMNSINYRHDWDEQSLGSPKRTGFMEAQEYKKCLIEMRE